MTLASAHATTPSRRRRRPGSFRSRSFCRGPLARRRRRPHRLALQLLQPAERARAAAGRAGTAVLDLLRQTPDVGPSALAEEDIDEMVHSAEQPGGTRAILEMYRARQTDAEQNRPHYADPMLPGPGRRRAGLPRGTTYPDSSRKWPATSAAPSSPRPVTTSRWRIRPPWPRPTSTSSQAAKPRVQPRDPAAYRSSIRRDTGQPTYDLGSNRTSIRVRGGT